MIIFVGVGSLIAGMFIGYYVREKEAEKEIMHNVVVDEKNENVYLVEPDLRSMNHFKLREGNTYDFVQNLPFFKN